MSIPPNLPGQRKAHPARHVFSITGISLFTAFIIGSFFIAAVYMQNLIRNNQLAAVVTATLVDLANGDREAEDLGTLTVNPVLVAAAQAKADDMAAKGYFAHISPDGHNSWYWFKEAGYIFSYAGENLAVNFSDSDDVERAWMKSPTHRANIMNGKFTEIGIATAVGEYNGKKTVFVAQMFGTPAKSKALAQAKPIQVTEAVDPTEIALAETETPSDEPFTIEDEEPAAATTAPIGLVESESATGISEPAPRYAGALAFFASSPQNLLQAIYLLSAIIILIALLFTTELEFKKHHMRHVAAAVFMLALMGGLFAAAEYLVFTNPVVGGASIEAS